MFLMVCKKYDALTRYYYKPEAMFKDEGLDQGFGFG